MRGGAPRSAGLNEIDLSPRPFQSAGGRACGNLARVYAVGRAGVGGGVSRRIKLFRSAFMEREALVGIFYSVRRAVGRFIVPGNGSQVIKALHVKRT